MKKSLKVFLVTIIVVALFTGCGKPVTPKVDPDNTGKVDSNGVEKDKKNEKGDIVITVMANGTESEGHTLVYKAMGEEFTTNNEWGAKINMEFYENEQFKTKLATLMAANSVPDIFFTWELDYLRPFVEGGKVYPIGEILDQDKEWKESFLDGMLEPLIYDGQLYAIPTQTTLAVMFYNKQIFQDNGVEVPTTYEDFLNACETFKNNDVTPMLLSAVDSWIPAQFIQQISNGIAGLDLYEGIQEGRRKWNDPAHVEAGEEVQMMIDKGYFQAGMLGMETEEVQTQFKQGKAAMYYMGAWDIATILDDETSEIKDIVGAFSMPAKNPMYHNIPVGSVDTNYAISESCEEKEIAVAFLKFMSSKETQLNLLYELGRFPSIKADIDESKVQPLVSEVIGISSKSQGVTPWWDRAFGAGEGVEFNNQCIAIFGGSDPQKAFDELQSFAEENTER